jgi:hypothetical protein
MDFFQPLPADFDQLAHAARMRRGNAMGKEPDLRSVGERTYSAFQGDSPRQRDWRNLPYALWLSAQRGLHTQPELTQRYFQAMLPQALQTRRPLRWGRAMLHTYLQQFDPDNALFLQLAYNANHFFADPRVFEPLGDTEAHGLQRLLQQLRLLDPLSGPQLVAQDIVRMPPDVPLHTWQAHHALTGHFWLNPFARTAFAHALQASEDERMRLPWITRICEWALHDAGLPTQRFRYPLLRDEFAWALLSPWFERTPPMDVQQRLLSELLRILGDPRHDHAGWLGVRKEAMDTASRWLNARTLDAFFDILRHTQDDIGPWRRRFWEAYFHAGHVHEAWIALGEDAEQTLVQQGVAEGLSGHYARILGRIAPQQSVLMVRMGHLLFCDWSHQGRLRAIPANHKQAPKLYKTQYELFELRFPTPLDFNQGRFDDPGLLHHDSALGGWQTVARDFIAEHLGVNLSLTELMPADAI